MMKLRDHQKKHEELQTEFALLLIFSILRENLFFNKKNPLALIQKTTFIT